MNNPLDLFAWKLRSERKRQHLTQKALAERLHMSVRTIIEIEKCKRCLCREKQGGDPEIYRGRQTGGDITKRQITRSGLMCPAALLFYPIFMRANQSSICEL